MNDMKKAEMKLCNNNNNNNNNKRMADSEADRASFHFTARLYNFSLVIPGVQEYTNMDELNVTMTFYNYACFIFNLKFPVLADHAASLDSIFLHFSVREGTVVRVFFYPRNQKYNTLSAFTTMGSDIVVKRNSFQVYKVQFTARAGLPDDPKVRLKLN